VTAPSPRRNAVAHGKKRSWLLYRSVLGDKAVGIAGTPRSAKASQVTRSLPCPNSTPKEQDTCSASRPPRSSARRGETLAVASSELNPEVDLRCVDFAVVTLSGGFVGAGVDGALEAIVLASGPGWVLDLALDEISLFDDSVKLPAGGSQGATQVGSLDWSWILLATEAASRLGQLGQAFGGPCALGSIRYSWRVGGVASRCPRGCAPGQVRPQARVVHQRVRRALDVRRGPPGPPSGVSMTAVALAGEMVTRYNVLPL
jgi:hypothetical protein